MPMSDISGIGFLVFQISGNSLTYVAQVANIASTGYNMVVSGNQVYVAGGYSGLEIMNVSNPYTPSLLGQYNDSGLFSGNYFSCAVNRQFPLCAIGGFNLFDVSQPTHPTLSNFKRRGSPVVAGNGVAICTDGTCQQRCSDNQCHYADVAAIDRECLRTR